MREVKLGEIAEVFGGYAFKSKDFNETSGVPVIKISNIQDGEVSEETLKQYLPKSYLDDYENYQITKGDILVALSGATTGKTGVYKLEKKSLLNQRVGLVRAKNGQADQKYLSYYVSKITDDILNKAKGVAQPNISTKELAKFEVPLPSLSEQKAIVAKLDRAQRLIDIDREMLAKYDELVQSVFLEMFGDPAFNPKDWKTKPIKDLLTTQKVKRENPKRTEKVYDYISISDVDNDLKRIIGHTAVDRTGAPSRARQLLKSSDILVSTVRPNLNAVALYKNGLSNPIASTGFCVLRPDPEVINPHYLYQISKSRYFVSELSLIANGASYPAVTDQDILNLEIPLPLLEKQNKFEEIIEKIGQEYQVTQTNQKKSEALFSSLVQRAFL